MNWRGYTDLQTETVRWRGLSCVYSLAEIDVVSELGEDEQWLVHNLKALFGGEIMEPGDEALQPAQAVESLSPETTKGPSPAPRRRRGEPLVGQTTIAV